MLRRNSNRGSRRPSRHVHWVDQESESNRRHSSISRGQSTSYPLQQSQILHGPSLGQGQQSLPAPTSVPGTVVNYGTEGRLPLQQTSNIQAIHLQSPQTSPLDYQLPRSLFGGPGDHGPYLLGSSVFGSNSAFDCDAGPASIPDCIHLGVRYSNLVVGQQGQPYESRLILMRNSELPHTYVQRSLGPDPEAMFQAFTRCHLEETTPRHNLDCPRGLLLNQFNPEAHLGHGWIPYQFFSGGEHGGLGYCNMMYF